MERWERIERVVLLAACSVLVALSVWLFFHESGIRLLLAVVPLPFAFWTLWQALYEDKLDSAEPPTIGEYIAYYSWLAVRRMIVGAIAVAMGWAAFLLAIRANSAAHFAVAGLVALLAVVAGWVAFFGGGVSRSMADDSGVYRRRRDRYTANKPRPRAER